MRCAPLWKGRNNIRNDVCWKDWMIWAEGALQDDFLESVFFTGNGRMGGARVRRRRPAAPAGAAGLVFGRYV